MEENKRITIELVAGQGYVCESGDGHHKVDAVFYIKEALEARDVCSTYVCRDHLLEVVEFLLCDEDRR